MTKPKGVRLDLALVERGLVESRQKAQAMVRAGQVRVDGRVCDKPATPVLAAAEVTLEGVRDRFVSRGGHKLDAALEAWPVATHARVCADLGASTGGFTDCLLQRGAARVYAIDVGYGQLDWKLRQDPRVVVMERTNARHLTSLPEPISLIVGDLSFISLEKILPTIQRLLSPGGEAVLLVKPQFEVGPERVGRGGLVKEEADRQAALQSVASAAEQLGFRVGGSMSSPIAGAKSGNVEWLLWLQRGEVTIGVDVL